MESNDKKKKILEGWTSQSDPSLLRFILDRTISISELEQKISLDKDNKNKAKLENLKKLLKDKESEMWGIAEEEDTIEAYRSYIICFGSDGYNSENARVKLEEKDADLWHEVKNNPSEDIIKKYQELLPDGLFAKECQKLLDDLPWYKTKARNTIAAYNEYQVSYPGKHESEIKTLIAKIIDNQDWETACKNGSTEAYNEYLKKHKDGLCLHKDDALYKIKNRSGKDLFLDELRIDINKYPVKGDEWNEGIREKIENNVATWDDLRAIFDEVQIEAVRDYEAPRQLPLVKDYEKLPRGYTEVYFWGLRGTGKTCAIGATIGYLRNVRRSINPITCPGDRYLYQLENLFKADGKVCSLPPGTVNGNLPAMAFSFRDKRNKDHRTMLIDVAGEVFAGIFKTTHKIEVAPDEKDAIDHLTRCLNDKFNNKIHFFIIEYGNDEILNIDGYGPVAKSQIMQSLIGYFAQERLFRKSSVSMNILVTKCDRIKNVDSREQRMEIVQDYIDNRSKWGAVVNGINQISVNARCGGINVIGFSIGKVFAQDLCIYDPTDAEKIIKEIEDRTHPFDTTWLGILLNYLRN